MGSPICAGTWQHRAGAAIDNFLLCNGPIRSDPDSDYLARATCRNRESSPSPSVPDARAVGGIFLLWLCFFALVVRVTSHQGATARTCSCSGSARHCAPANLSFGRALVLHSEQTEFRDDETTSGSQREP